MPNRAMVRNVKAKELSPGLRRRFHLAPDEEISVTVTKGKEKKKRARKDPWTEIKGILSPEEAEDMLRAFHESRRNKRETPELESS